MTREDRFLGMLLGGAIGDALGGPYENSPPPIEFSIPETFELSDDTALTLATCRGIIEAEGVSAEVIAKRFLESFRNGAVQKPGASTLKALRDLDAGHHWALSGARGERAAGNGAAMRAAPLGFFLSPHDSNDRMLLRDVCRITHHSEEAYVGALTVVSAIDLSPDERVLSRVHDTLPDSVTKDRLGALLSSDPPPLSKLPSSGYVADSVTVALAHAAEGLTSGVLQAIQGVIELGGDTDTNSSICGQVLGSWIGAAALPSELVNRVPAAEEMRSIAARLSELKS